MISQNNLFYFQKERFHTKNFHQDKIFIFYFLHLENVYKDFSIVVKKRKKFLQGTKLKRVFFIAFNSIGMPNLKVNMLEYTK